MTKRDYYEVLGVSRSATDADIKKAFRRLAKKLHPDQNKGDASAETRFKELQEAYAVLSDPGKRRQYDQFGHAAPGTVFPPGGHGHVRSSGGVPVDFGDLADLFDFSFDQQPRSGRGASIFDAFMGGEPGRRQQAAVTPAEDLESTVSLTFEQAVRGTTLDLEVSRGSRKRERISVHIPPGVRSGQRVRIRGKGKPGRGRRAAGDLYVICDVQPHPYFERRDEDLYLTVPVTVSEAALGAKVDLPTLDGTRTVTIPPGTASGAKLRLAGLGVPNPKGESRGDQYVVIKIVPPKPLTEKQRQLLEQLAETEAPSPRDGLWP
ncbi:MAG: DnaJ C-terminal domain-containing protein [Phycisphaerae bacterium]